MFQFLLELHSVGVISSAVKLSALTADIISLFKIRSQLNHTLAVK